LTYSENQLSAHTSAVKVDDCSEVVTVLVDLTSVAEGAETVDVVDVVDNSEVELHAASPRIASVKTVERNSFMMASRGFGL
jgi:hypothetical protein